MKLVLKEAGAPRTVSSWVMEHGRKSIGRSSECDWQIGDDERRVSKLHCLINRDRDAFVLVDKSANGTLLDGRLLQEGDSARLANGSRIEIGGRSFDVTITGEADLEYGDPDPDLRMSDENLTISSILADVAPGGRSARSILGKRDFAEDLPQNDSLPGGKAGKVISRNVEIGWSEPPATSSIAPILPDDWDIDPSASSLHEHTDARRTAVSLPRPPAGAPKPDFDDVFPVEETPAPEPVIADPHMSGLDRLAEALMRLETEMAECLSILDLDYPMATGRREPATEAGLAARLDDLATQQRALAAAIESLIAQCTQKLEPRLIEARGERQPQSWQVWMKKPDHWASYKQQFESNGRQMSVREFLQKAARGEHVTGTQPATSARSDKGDNPHNEA